MNISNETWKRAVDCAAAQFESYYQQDLLVDLADRRRAIDDCLQHAIGIISVAEGRITLADLAKKSSV